MKNTPYTYQKRPLDFLNYHCLDFNEYQGDIASSAFKILENKGELLRHYPNTKDPLLLSEASRRFQVPTSNISLANGADSALFHILLTNKLHKKYTQVKSYFHPTYDHFLHFAKNLGFALTPPPSQSQGQEFKNEIVYASFPNNPTGEEIDPEHLEKCIKNSKNSLWLLDMAYLFYSQYKIEDCIQKLLPYKNVIMIMSLNKSFPMAGLRMAFVLSSRLETIYYFDQEYNQKTVGTFARILALDCLKNYTFYEEQRKQIWNNRTRLAKLFDNANHKQNRSLAVSPLALRGGNFFLMKGSARERGAFVNWLYSVKIIVRNKPSWDFIRITSVSDSLFKRIKKILA